MLHQAQQENAVTSSIFAKPNNSISRNQKGSAHAVRSPVERRRFTEVPRTKGSSAEFYRASPRFKALNLQKRTRAPGAKAVGDPAAAPAPTIVIPPQAPDARTATRAAIDTSPKGDVLPLQLVGDQVLVLGPEDEVQTVGREDQLTLQREPEVVAAHDAGLLRFLQVEVGEDLAGLELSTEGRLDPILFILVVRPALRDERRAGAVDFSAVEDVLYEAEHGLGREVGGIGLEKGNLGRKGHENLRKMQDYGRTDEKLTKAS